MGAIEDKVLEAQSDYAVLEDLISEYKPFIMSCAKKAAGRYVNQNDDYMSVALIAFNESVEAFNPDKGNFLTFSDNVIKRRIIDYLRSESRHKSIPFSEIDAENSEDDEKSFVESIPDTKSAFDGDPLRLEIEALTDVLKQYDISFEDLVKCSPKAIKTKKACGRAVYFSINNPEVLEVLRKTKNLPVKKICELSGVPRKIIERHRKYIVAVIEIFQGDYNYLTEYVSFVKEESL